MSNRVSPSSTPNNSELDLKGLLFFYKTYIMIFLDIKKVVVLF